MPEDHADVVTAAAEDGKDCVAIGSLERTSRQNIWQFLRQTYLSNRVFENWEEIVDACCDAWNRLTTDTGRIKSIATRNWATTGQ